MAKKADFNWGYREAAKLMGKSHGGPVQVKGYMRGGAVKAPVKKPTKKGC